MSERKVLFFVPHPDDLEFGAPFMCLDALRVGNEVVEVLMTNGEYGTNSVEFRGIRLKTIRKKEIENAIKVYTNATNNKLRLIRMGYIDGRLPLNKDAIQKVASLIIKEQPNIIFAPDPWYPVDSHPDHLNTGRLVYYALRSLSRNHLPKNIFYFYSFNTNLAIKTRKSNAKLMLKALCEHRSQVVPSKASLMVGFEIIKLLWQLGKSGGISVRVRKQEFENGLIKPFKTYKTVKQFIKYQFYYKFAGIGLPDKFQYVPSAEELGLLL